MRNLKVTTTIVETIRTMQTDEEVVTGTETDFRDYVDPDATISVDVEEILPDESEPDESTDMDTNSDDDPEN